jgi:DNA polymerase I
MKEKRNKPTALIIDGNNLLFRCYYKFTGMVSKSGIPSSMVFGYPYTLRSLLNRFTPHVVYNVFDGGKDLLRKEILPDYKLRDQKLGFDIEDFKLQKDVIMELCYNMGMHVIQQRHKEADDFIYMLVRKLDKTHKVIIVSSDKDFNQLVTSNITCFNPHQGIEITHKNMRHRFGYEPQECVDYLILDGDSSDNIPGYKGMGEKTIRLFLDSHSSIKNYLTNKFQFRKLDNALVESIYKRNRFLIDLAYFYRKNHRKLKLPYLYGKEPKFNKMFLHTVCDKYDINTFLKSDFQKPFKALK